MQRVFTSIPQKRKHPMGSHYPGTSLRGANSHAKTKETHEQSTLSCPAASFCPSFCSRQDLIGALNQKIWAALHFSSLLVFAFLGIQRWGAPWFVHQKKLSQQWKKNQKVRLKFVYWLNIFLKSLFFFFLNSGEIFYSRHFCPNLGSLTLYSKSILSVSKMLISLHTRNCKALLGIEVTRKHFHN